MTDGGRLNTAGMNDATTSGFIPRWSRRMTLLVALVLGLTLYLRVSPALFQPLRRDEAATARLYASFDYETTMAAMRSEGAFNANRLARGVGKALLQKWDPNNHFVNSIAISCSCFVFGFSEWAMRLPALLASALAVFLLMRQAWIWSRNDWTAAGLGLLLCANPYSIHYGQTARGYAFMLVMILIQIALIERADKRGLSLRLNIVMAALSFALFLNTVSLAFAWLAPLYAVILNRSVPIRSLFSGEGADAFKRGWEQKEFRQWFWQAASVGCGIVAFVALNREEILHAGSRYGTSFSSIGEMAGVILFALFVVFPASWIVAPALAVFYSRAKDDSVTTPAPWLGAVTLVSAAALLVYIAIAGAVPYGRTFGFLLIPTLLAFARPSRPDFEEMRDFVRMEIRRFFRIFAICLCAVPFSEALTRRGADRVGYNVVAKEISELVTTSNGRTTEFFAPIPAVYGEDMNLYLPEDRSLIRFNPNAEKITVLLVIEAIGDDTPYRFRLNGSGNPSSGDTFLNIPEIRHPRGSETQWADKWDVTLLSFQSVVHGTWPHEIKPSKFFANVFLFESEEGMRSALAKLESLATATSGIKTTVVHAIDGRPGMLVFEGTDGDFSQGNFFKEMADRPDCDARVLTLDKGTWCL